MKGIAIMNSIS